MDKPYRLYSAYTSCFLEDLSLIFYVLIKKKPKCLECHRAVARGGRQFCSRPPSTTKITTTRVTTDTTATKSGRPANSPDLRTITSRALAHRSSRVRTCPLPHPPLVIITISMSNHGLMELIFTSIFTE
ncbi:unnamed protein product [Nesidiocoris tenuis]|uniref:Uncharacterized protein n=1 Tax=Nesidiocoris tenuis TaxID=355587 RepID=A0A6H5GVP2_9HEMI|nr:unnamed protein product [Nesidiocoris tenuis]